MIQIILQKVNLVSKINFMKKIETIILGIFFISCSSSKVERQIIDDFLSKEPEIKKVDVLVEEAIPKTKALDFYENAYKDRNLVKTLGFSPIGSPPFTWEVDSIDVTLLKQKYKNDTLVYHWKSSDLIDHKLKIFPYKTLKKRGSSDLGEYGIYLSKPLITSNKKYAFIFYRSFAVEVGFSSEKAVLLKKVDGTWQILYYYVNNSEVN